LNIPNYKDRTPEEIITDKISFESDYYIYRALSWIDYSRKNECKVSMLYAAMEVRLGIEQLLFEELVMSVGLDFNVQEYKNCIGNSTKLHKIIRRSSLI